MRDHPYINPPSRDIKFSLRSKPSDHQSSSDRGKKDESEDQTGESSDLFDVRYVKTIIDKTSIKETGGGGTRRSNVFTYVELSCSLIHECIEVSFATVRFECWVLKNRLSREEEKGGLENILYTRWTSR